MEIPKFFFSYVREDSVFVLRLAKELRSNGASLWLDRLDIRGGERWDEAVQRALQSCQGMLAVLSPGSVASENVMDEVSYALEERKQVIPVLYQECTIPFRLRRVQYVDFSSGYDDGFAELLRALGLEQPAEKIAPPRIEERGPEEAIQPAIHEEGQRGGSIAAEQEVRPVAEHVPGVEPRPRPVRPRRKGASVGAISGSMIGAVSFLASEATREGWWAAALFLGFFGAIVGAITGTNRRVVTFTMATWLAGTVSVALTYHNNPSFFVVLFAPLIAIIGAAAGVVLDRFKRRRQ